MNYLNLTLRDLQYLSVLAQTKHFGKAAQLCNVSQPALSSQIKKIESVLGVCVFERNNRNVGITELGQQLVRQANTILSEAQKLHTLAEQSSNDLSGPLHVGVIATLGPYYIPGILPLLKKAFPKLQIILREGLTDELLQELKEGQLDVVLAAQTFDEKNFSVYPLFFEPFLLAAEKTHPILDQAKVTPADLKSSEMILLEDGHCLRDQALQLCPPHRKGAVRQFHATSLETIKYLVASSQGYTLMPELACKKQDGALLRYRPLQGSKIGRTIVLVCRDTFYKTRAVRELVTFLKKNSPRFQEE